MLTAAGAVQRSYTTEEKGAALFGLDLNGGVERTTAQALDIPRTTLRQWDDNRHEPALELARANASSPKNVQDLASLFFELARRAVLHSMDNLEKATPYHGALIGAIALDKWALITGRPTSRTEVLRARYVEPAALREVASTVIDVPQRRRGVREGAGPSHLAPTQKRAPRRMKRKGKIVLEATSSPSAEQGADVSSRESIAPVRPASALGQELPRADERAAT